MKNAIVTLSSVCLLCACGMENEGATGTQSDSLYSSTLATGGTVLTAQHADVVGVRDAMDWNRLREIPSAQRAEYCQIEMIRPLAQGTIQSIPRLGVFGVAPVGGEVQSSYFRSNAANEEFRKGIAEFYVAGEFTGAVLQFREHRGWTSYPLPADTHNIEAYAGNGELDVEDFGERAVLVGQFESDPNLEPVFANNYDVTKAVQQIGGGKIGLRFSINGGVGSGTSFMDLALEVNRCRSLTRPGF
jgi:hypothetical protein